MWKVSIYLCQPKANQRSNIKLRREGVYVLHSVSLYHTVGLWPLTRLHTRLKDMWSVLSLENQRRHFMLNVTL